MHKDTSSIKALSYQYLLCFWNYLEVSNFQQCKMTGDERGVHELWQQKYVLIGVKVQNNIPPMNSSWKIILRHNPSDKYTNQMWEPKKGTREEKDCKHNEVSWNRYLILF